MRSPRGGSLTLDGSRSSDEDDDPLTYEWDLNTDGVVDVVGVAPTLTWATLNSLGIRGDGTYTVGLRVRDPQGNSSNGAATLTVTNVAPAAVADAYATGHGATLTVAASAGVLANDSDAGGDLLARFSFPARPTGRSRSTPTGRSPTCRSPGSPGPTRSFTGRATGWP